MGSSSLPSSSRPRGDDVSIGNTRNRLLGEDAIAKLRDTLKETLNRAVDDGQLDGLMDLFGGCDRPSGRSLRGVSSSSVHQSTRSGTTRDGSSGKRSKIKDTLADGIYHLRYVVVGFLEKQNEPNANLTLEDGLFPKKLGWFELFQAGLEAEEKKGLHGLRPPDSEPLDRIPPPSTWSKDERQKHEDLVKKLRRAREQRNWTVVALCQTADPSSTTVPWRSLLPAQPPVEPDTRHVHNTAAPIVLYGPRSYIECDCRVEDGCKFQEARDDQAFKVAYGVAWCNGRGCTCAPGKQKVKIMGFMSCSWTSPVGKRLVDVPTVEVPEAGVPSSGIECEWYQSLIDTRTEYDTKPDGRKGRWSHAKLQQGRQTREMNKALKEAGQAHGASTPATGTPTQGNSDLTAEKIAMQPTGQGNVGQPLNPSNQQKRVPADPARSGRPKRSNQGKPARHFDAFVTDVDETGG